MLGKSSTGQLAGFLIKNWMPNSIERFVTNENDSICGLEYGARQLIRLNDKIKRVIVNIGPPVASMKRLCKDFGNREVREVFLPRWTVIDVLIKNTPEEEPSSLTFLQVAEAVPAGVEENTDGYKYVQNIFINNKQIFTSSDKTDSAFWDRLNSTFGKLHATEFWAKMTGAIRPSWGILGNGRKGAIFMPEQNVHYSFMTPSISSVSNFLDDFDLLRIEKLMESSGIPSLEFVKQNVSREYIMNFIKKLSAPDNEDNILSSDKEYQENISKSL